MNNKEQILTLLKDKKFKDNEFKGLFEKEWKHNSKEDLRWLFYLTELQKWLRDNYQLYVNVASNSLDTHFAVNSILEDGTCQLIGPIYKRFNEPEKALEYAILNALKHLIL